MMALFHLGYLGMLLGGVMHGLIIPWHCGDLVQRLLAADYSFFFLWICASLGMGVGSLVTVLVGRRVPIEWVESFVARHPRTGQWVHRLFVGRGGLLCGLSFLPAVGPLFLFLCGVYRVSPRRVALGVFLGRLGSNFLWMYTLHFLGSGRF